MTSVAQHFFPPVVFRKGKKYIWNPIEKKPFKDRPEERVRQRIIDFILTTDSWSPHRLGLEVPLMSPNSKTPKRADLICYDDDFTPTILVECKSEDVSLNEKAARQITRYNQQLQVPFLLLTNGLQDLWYDLRNHAPRAVSEEELPIRMGQLPTVEERGFRYWNQHGFMGRNAVPEVRRWSMAALEALDIAQLGSGGSGSVRYININKKLDDLSPSHYYRVVPVGGDGSSAFVAITVASTPYSGTRLMAIYIVENRAELFLAVNLDLMASDMPINATLYSPDKAENFDAAEQLSINLQDPTTARFDSLKTAILQQFENVPIKS